MVPSLVTSCGLGSVCGRSPEMEVLVTDETLERAIDAFNRGAHQLCVDLLGDVLARHPDVALVKWLMSRSLSELGRFDEALDMADQAIALAPDDQGAHTARAVAMRLLGRTDEAEASCAKALEVAPGGEVQWFIYCRCAIDRRDDESLAERLPQLMKVLPEHAVSHAIQSGYHLRQGDLADAELSIRRALSIDPELAEAHVGLAHVLLQQGNAEDAFKAAETALRLRPSDNSVKAVLKKAKGSRRDQRQMNALAHAVCYFGFALPFSLMIALYAGAGATLIYTIEVLGKNYADEIFLLFGIPAMLLMIGIEVKVRQEKPDRRDVFFNADF